MSSIFQSLIQSNFGDARHGNFEAVLVEGESLAHWWRDNSVPWRPWNRGQHIVNQGVAGAGSIIQSNFGEARHGNFEVVVPLRAGGRVELWHFFHDNSDVAKPWQRGQRVTGDTDDVAGPGALIQSNFGSRDHGNFEVVVPLRAASGRVELWHYFHDNSDVAKPWQRGLRVTGDTDDVAGPGALIQSNFGSDDHGNFEVVVPLRAAGGRIELWHFFHDNSDVALPWQRALRVAAEVTGPGVLIQSDFGTGKHGNFEVLVPEGQRLAHYWHDNADVTAPWQRGQTVTESLSGWASLRQSDFGAGKHKNFEALIEECGASVIGYWHSNTDVNAPWLRDKPVIPRGYQIRLPNTHKIVQLTGEFDRQGWNGVGTPPRAHNQTETRFGIRGTDLGSSFVHKGRTYFLFGDTWRVNQSKDEINLDSIAFTTDIRPDDGLDLVFLNRPPIVSPPIPQREFDVPLDGVSDGQSMFVFFSTDHFQVEDHDLMGRSILARSHDDGLTFEMLYSFSSSKFINVSVERLSLEREEARLVGVSNPDVLCIWGSGRYRSSDVYLVILPMAELATGRGRRFYAGRGGSHVWSNDENDATPLFCAGCVGELSARWNPILGRFLLMYNGDSPGGIVLHVAQKPWGPWTKKPGMVFDPFFRAPGLDPTDPCLGDGYGKFLHVSWDVKRCDHLQDDMFGSARDNEWGGVYGPYQIANMSKGSPGKEAQIYFAMSTWNPYQAVLMTTRLDAATVAQLYEVDETLAALSAANIDFSVPESDLRDWLQNAAFTPYPALAQSLLALVGSRKLRKPVFLDVIAFNYEHSPGVVSPRAVADVRGDVLKKAVLDGYNERNGTSETTFDALVS
jgi:hypothetical protein